MNSATHIDSNIPVLTEVISTNNATNVICNAQEEISPTPAAPTNFRAEQTLDEFKKTLHENVLRQMLTRIDFVLEHRIQDSLASVLETAVDDLAKNIRQGLNTSLEELIQRSISQEISKLQSLKSN